MGMNKIFVFLLFNLQLSIIELLIYPYNFLTMTNPVDWVPEWEDGKKTLKPEEKVVSDVRDRVGDIVPTDWFVSESSDIPERWRIDIKPTEFSFTTPVSEEERISAMRDLTNIIIQERLERVPKDKLMVDASGKTWIIDPAPNIEIIPDTPSITLDATKIDINVQDVAGNQKTINTNTIITKPV